MVAFQGGCSSSRTVPTARALCVSHPGVPRPVTKVTAVFSQRPQPGFTRSVEFLPKPASRVGEALRAPTASTMGLSAPTETSPTSLPQQRFCWDSVFLNSKRDEPAPMRVPPNTNLRRNAGKRNQQRQCQVRRLQKEPDPGKSRLFLVILKG